MRQYEVTFIVDPVLSGDEIKAAAKSYETLLTEDGCTIVHVEKMGLKQLAYSINRRNTGIYHVIEFQIPNGSVIPKLELSLSRDERIMRFLTASLDKYGVKYNEDRRNGLIGKKKPKEKVESKQGPISQDLTKIEGIGPKIQDLLYGAGISTYADLSKQSAGDIKVILDKGGSAVASKDPGTWAAQAGMASKGDWDELKKFQKELMGGKVVKPAISEEE